MSVSLKLENIAVDLNQLMLDPNNYRLSYDTVDKYSNDDDVVEMQDQIEKKLSKEKLSDLIDSILTNGFLEVDRIVVRKLKNAKGKYLVVEGNRRTAALKSLLQDHNDGFITLSETLLDKISSLGVVLINAIDEDEIKNYQHTLMGVRHVSGPKKWTGMQSAKLICDLIEQNKTPTQIGALLGISAIEANRRMRGYLAYRQLDNDGKYGDHIKSKHYALLLEFMSKSEIRNWLKWSDEKMITSKKHRHILYSHIVKMPNMDDVEIKNPSQAREFCKAISIPKFREQIEKNFMLSTLGPITDSIEEQDAEIKQFSSFLNSIRRDELSKGNLTSLATIKIKVSQILEEA